MNAIREAQEIDHDRRRFPGTAAAAVITANFGLVGSGVAQSNKVTATALTQWHASFTSLKQIEAGVLNVGYAEAGPTDGPAVILLHGWPYDIYSFVDVTPLLASKGYHVIVPYLRGYGPTTFLPSANMRNAHRFARPKRCPEWNQSADGARLPQTWRCRESAGCYLGEIPH